MGEVIPFPWDRLTYPKHPRKVEPEGDLRKLPVKPPEPEPDDGPPSDVPFSG